MSFPSQSGFLYLLPLQFETNLDCVFSQYVLQVICEAIQVESREVSDDGVVGWSKENAFEEGPFLLSQVKQLKGKKPTSNEIEPFSFPHRTITEC